MIMIVVRELDLEESGFKSLLSPKASWVTLDLYIPVSPTSQGCWEDKRRRGTMYITLSFLEER